MAACAKTWRPSAYYVQDGQYLQIPFDDCIVNRLKDSTSDATRVKYEFKDGRLSLTSSAGGIELFHAPNCPLKEFQSSKHINKQISLGAASLILSNDGHILLTRRPKHLRLFPGIWVPPGGHVEKGESLLEACVRELKEETGIWLHPEEYNSDELCLFESCYPPFLEWGDPVGHHVVIYYLLRTTLNKNELDERVKLDENEVDAYVWLTETTVQNIVTQSYNDISQPLWQTTVKDGKKMNEHFDLSILTFQSTVDQDKDIERLSTGTKFALRCTTEKK